MAIRFRCVCGQKLKTQDDTVGKRAKCPKCDKWLIVPQSVTYDTVAQEYHRDDAENEPAGARPPVAALHDEEPPPPQPPKDKARLVLADGVPAERAALAGMLRDHGYVVVEATDGPTAVQAIRKECPDAAIVDVRLEGLSGFHVIEQITNPANALNKDVWTTPMLMTTSRLRGRDKQYAMSLGVHGFMLKPISPSDLFPKLEKAITKRPGA